LRRVYRRKSLAHGSPSRDKRNQTGACNQLHLQLREKCSPFIRNPGPVAFAELKELNFDYRIVFSLDRCYRSAPFDSDREHVEHLFALYEQLTAPLLPAAPKSRQRTRKA